jgi:hypothetical protein
VAADGLSDAPESVGINLENERSLHAALKRWLAQPGDRFEVPVDGSIIDLVRGDTLIEVQTGGFTAIRTKLGRLLAEYDVRLAYPVSAARWIVHVDPETGERVSRRKSPKRGRITDLFDEMVRMPKMALNPRFELLVLMVHEEQIRCDDGQGSWRRKRVSIRDRELLDVVEQVSFRGAAAYAALLPDGLEPEFTNRELAAALHIRRAQAMRMSYCLRAMGELAVVGKRGRERLYASSSGATA